MTAREVLIQFYSQKKPEKVSKVDELLQKYKGNEETLIRKVARTVSFRRD